MIPALEEQHERFLKLLQIAKRFGYSEERIAKGIDITRQNLFRIRAGDWKKHPKYMRKYLELNKKLGEFSISHIEGNIEHYNGKIEESEASILEIKGI